ncbi:MAG TPA: class I SAM-dependent methyltransferase [Acetobacteraceae bacterium]|nr:class I SAM-dependent methyltransferase [Acetobacteraceae bacterium]
MSDNPATADFGYRTVPRAAKSGMVRAVFASVAPRYDLMNDLMSLGVHRLWKRRLVSLLAPRPAATLLDLAGGTGDISFAWQDEGGGPVILSDINPAMLAIAHRRAVDRARLAGLSLLVADAERLPLPDRGFHAITIAFGLRNCTDKASVLAEARRVLRPGGRFFCLEFSRFEIAALVPLYEAWSFAALPTLGRCVAGDAASYRYLAESIRTFPDPETLAAMMREAGFSRITIERLSGGIAAIHSGWRL